MHNYYFTFKDPTQEFSPLCFSDTGDILNDRWVRVVSKNMEVAAYVFRTYFLDVHLASGACCGAFFDEEQFEEYRGHYPEGEYAVIVPDTETVKEKKIPHSLKNINLNLN